MTKPKNPLSSMKKKEKSYIGNLDDLMKDTVDEAESDENKEQAGEEGRSPKSASALSSDAESLQSESPEDEIVETPQKHLNLKINHDLHRQFKGIVGMQGLTMTEVLEEMIASYVAEKKNDLL